MNRREKILAASCGLVAVGFVTYLAIHRVFLEPAADCRKQADELRDRINKAEIEKNKEASYRTRLHDLAASAFGTDEMRVSEQVRTVITTALGLSGLGTQNLSLKPLVGARVPGVYREIGWSVRARGKLNQIVNFLYLMSEEAHLHRLDNLVLAPVPTSGEVEVQVKYATLLLDSPPGEKLVTGEIDSTLEAAILESPDRRQYDVIVARDLFRPYIPAKPQAAEPTRQASAPPRPRSGEGRLKVVGLPTWGGRADVLVSDGDSITSYKAGDTLAGGKIVMVDYRPLPSPKNPEILSPSRVVMAFGTEYFAVELGQSLADKRPLAAAEWPAGLPKIESPGAAAPPQAEKGNP